MQRELSALTGNGTYDIVPRPQNANIIKSRWTYKVRDPHSPETLKSRIVAKGFSQKPGIDFTETYAPTASADSIRLFLAVTAHLDLECDHVDVNNAFTESVLRETIHMEPAPNTDTPPGHVWLLRKSLYGLKQAAKDWYDTCRKQLLAQGFKPTPEDECVFINDAAQAYVLLYVDDILIAAKARTTVQEFKRDFGSRFKIMDLGAEKRIVGIDIERDREKRTLSMNQAH